MDPVTLVAIVVGLAVIGLLGWYLWQKRRTEELQARYGPEYSHAVDERGDKRKAEAELVRRQERVKHLDIRPLSAGERERFTERWHAVQGQFVDHPKDAVTEADRLIEEVMKARGYPVTDFEQRVADLSVHHPGVVKNYRAAYEIADRHRRGESSTEDLRQAMVYYRELFEDLLEDRESMDGRKGKKKDRQVERDVSLDRERAARADRGDRRTDADREVRS